MNSSLSATSSRVVCRDAINETNLNQLLVSCPMTVPSVRLTISTEFPVKPGAMLMEVLDLGGARARGWGCLADRRRESDCISTEFPVKPGAMLMEVLDLGGARARGWGCLADRRRES